MKKIFQSFLIITGFITLNVHAGTTNLKLLGGIWAQERFHEFHNPYKMGMEFSFPLSDSLQAGVGGLFNPVGSSAYSNVASPHKVQHHSAYAFSDYIVSKIVSVGFEAGLSLSRHNELNPPKFGSFDKDFTIAARLGLGTSISDSMHAGIQTAFNLNLGNYRGVGLSSLGYLSVNF